MAVCRSLIILLVLLVAPINSWSAPINVNSDFSSGLTGFESSGDVAVVSGVAVFTDENGGGTLLQSTHTGAGSFILTFDVFNGVSPKDPNSPPNSFADFAAITLYWSNSALTISDLATTVT